MLAGFLGGNQPEDGEGNEGEDGAAVSRPVEANRCPFTLSGRRPPADTLTRVRDYDVLVIGSGPGGRRPPIAAAKLGRRVAIVDRRDMVGGVCINTGTIPSKTLREAVLYLTGLSQRELYGRATGSRRTSPSPT